MSPGSCRSTPVHGLAACAVLILASRAHAVEDLEIETVAMAPGQISARLHVRATTRAGPLDGFIVSLAFDPAVVEVESINVAGDWLATNPPDLVTSRRVAGALAIAVLFQPDAGIPEGIPQAPAGAPQTIAAVDVRLRSDPDGAARLPARFVFTDGLVQFFDGPAVRNGLVIGGFDYLLRDDPEHLLRARDGGLVLLELFRRGDVDGNGVLEITDVVNNLEFQFLGTYDPICLDAHDFDDSGAIDITDPIANLEHQFLGKPPPAPPGAASCGADLTLEAPGSALDCAAYPAGSCGG